jgi:cobalt-precorrin-5B (C1)-methyltransferase
LKTKIKKLKKGYTTGVHTSFAFKRALECFLITKKKSKVCTNKMDNDDLDVTKGCKIIVIISDKKDNLRLNIIKHNPYIFRYKNSQIKIYAGVGVGVVTKDGLKPKKDFPAINPKPLEELKKIFQKAVTNDKIYNLYCAIFVENGEQIAKKTANAKVGVLGGISILGTTGFVKPISSTAYIQSINEEFNFALANNFDTVVLTIGNESLKVAKNLYLNCEKTYILEIGNFVYDSLKIATNLKFENIILVLGIGKAVKVSQGFKNTHNRFGSIDFDIIQQIVDIDIKQCLTIKRVQQLLGDDVVKFDKIILNKVQNQLNCWFLKYKIKVNIC